MTIGGYRVTESGDARVLETSSDLRITENLYAVEATLTSEGTVTSNAVLQSLVEASVSAASSIAVVAQVNRYGAVLVANNSTMVASVNRTTQGAVSLSAASSNVSSATYSAVAASGLSGTGSISLNDRVVKYANVETGLVSFIRSPESDYEDIRIAESGDTRITELIKTNTVEGTLIAEPTLIPFSSTWYVKRSGTWVAMEALKTKRSGSWVTPIKLNRKLNSGIWKRIY